MRQTLNLRSDPASAVVSIDPRNGHIVSMAARAPGANLIFNLAAQGKRQPGSTFKTFVLAEAIERGLDPDHTYYLSAPFTFQGADHGAPWNVHTDDYRYHGNTTPAWDWAIAWKKIATSSVRDCFDEADTYR